MVDVVARTVRSRMMSGIRGKNTLPERKVRSFLHKRGLRFGLHGKTLPGRPDLVMPRRGAVVFIHGCFWHRHPGCRFATTPATNKAFWQEKFAENVARDKRNRRALRALGWRVFTIWECSTSIRQLEAFAKKIEKVRR